MKFLKESLSEKVELYYPDLTINYQYNYYVDYWDGPQWEDTDLDIEWTYEVDKSDIFEFLIDNINKELEDKGIDPDELSDEEYEKYFEDNFDYFFDKYEKSILDHFEDDAKEDAESKYVQEGDDY